MKDISNISEVLSLMAHCFVGVSFWKGKWKSSVNFPPIYTGKKTVTVHPVPFHNSVIHHVRIGQLFVDIQHTFCSKMITVTVYKIIYQTPSKVINPNEIIQSQA